MEQVDVQQTSLDVDKGSTVFEESLSHGDPFSNDSKERIRWFQSLNAPRLCWEEGKVKIIGQVGKGDRGKVYKIQRGESINAVKFYRKGDVEEAARREYTGLLVTNHLFPDVFPEPLGELVDKRGKVIGLEMKFVDKRQVNDFLDMEEYGRSGVVRPKDATVVPKSFFERLKLVVKNLGEHNLWLTDFNGGKVLVDDDWNPTIVDVQYYPRSMYNWEPDATLGTIEEMEKIFSRERMGKEESKSG
ncbi:MAG: hypothetical protein ABIJ85_01210 [bacterium]